MPAKKRSLDSRLLAYSAMAGTFLAAGAAESQDCNLGVLTDGICFTDIADITLGPPTSLYGVDLDGAGGPEFRFLKYADTYGFRYIALVPVFNEELESVVGNFSSTVRGPFPNRPAALLDGDTIDQRAMALPITGVFWMSHNFEGKGDRFLGVKIAFTAHQTAHFGWVRINIPSGSSTITIKSFAYHTVPETPIRAGATEGSQLFSDGFESGDAAAWSTTVPVKP